MEHLNSSPNQEEPITPQQLAELVLQSAGVGEGPMTYAQRAEVLREIKYGATQDIRLGVDPDVYVSTLNHAIELTGDPVLMVARNRVHNKQQRRISRGTL